MSEETKALESMIGEEYKYGFTTDVEYEDFPKGISENIIRELSSRKDEPEWMLEFRLGDALRAVDRADRAALALRGRVRVGRRGERARGRRNDGGRRQPGGRCAARHGQY